VSGTLRDRIVQGVDREHLVRIIEDSLDDHDLVDVAAGCGLLVEQASRDELIHHLAGGFHGNEGISEALTQSLVRANNEIIDQVQSMAVSELQRALLDDHSELVLAKERLIVALLADERPEVNAMLKRFFDRHSSSAEASDKVSEQSEPPKADWISVELRRELEQARQERAELMSLLKEVRKLLERTSSLAVPEPSEEKPSPQERVGLFVDVQHIFYNARNFYGRKLDFKKLMEATTKDRVLVTAVAYLVLSPDVDQTNFITMLEQNGYSVREKLPRRRSDSLTLSDEELPMALDVLRRAENLDVAVLVGGDVDIPTLSQRIQGNGAKVELYGFPQNTTEDVLRAVDRFLPIDENLLLPQDYLPKRVHDTQHRAANRTGLARGYMNNQRRGWGSDVRGT